MNTVLEEAQKYAEHFMGVSRFLVRHRPRICPFELLLKFIPEQARILDIGCGAGFFLHICRAMRSAVFTAGVDASEVAITQASNIAAKNYAAGTYAFKACTEPQDWPILPVKPNVISLIDVLHHIPTNHQLDFVKAAAGLLEPGGILIIKDMLPTPFCAGVMNRLHDLVVARQWINYVDLPVIVAALSEHGFEIVHAEHARLYWYAHTAHVLRKKEQHS